MGKRIVSIWFPRLLSERMIRRRPELKDIPFIMVMPDRGKRIVKAVNTTAQRQGAGLNMLAADCSALVPGLELFEYDPEEPAQLLKALAEWCIRYAPFVSVDPPDGLLIDASGCTHLWGTEQDYLRDIWNKFKNFGYSTRVAMADTAGCAWAISHFGKNGTVIPSGKETEHLLPLPPAALRLDEPTLERLGKLGFQDIGSFLKIPRTALRRRFGQNILTRIAQTLGEEMEIMEPVRPIVPYHERLFSAEPIRTATGIEIALNNLLEMLCGRLHREKNGLRKCELHCYRVDGVVEKIGIGTGKPSRNVKHLFKLFELKIAQIEPDLGIELFVLEAPVVEELPDTQDKLWNSTSSNAAAIGELLDRIAGKTGPGAIRRYLPQEHYWPERSIKIASSLSEKAATAWRTDLPRPLHLLKYPEPIEVSVPVPDYPPMLFRYKGNIHTVKKADGPERIEQEWWIQSGQYRDYYCVEDQNGARYWLFRSGDYKSGTPRWYVHGFFC